MITIKYFDPFKASPDDWKDYHSISHTYHLQNYPEEPILPDSSEEEFIKSNFSDDDRTIRYYTVYNDSGIVGSFSLTYYLQHSKAFSDNELSLWFHLEVPNEFSTGTIREQIMKFIFTEGGKFNKEYFIIEYHSSSLKSFLESIGAKVVQTHIENRLLFSEIDWPLMEEWVVEGTSKNPETKLHIFEGPIPEELLIEYSKAFNETANLQPRGEVQEGDKNFSPDVLRKRDQVNQSAGIISFNTICVEPNGEISSITNLLLSPGERLIYRQSLTGVPIKHRGRKLGKLVKAKMVQYLKDKYPNSEYILTGNADDNESMISINSRMGFKKYKESLTSQATLDQLEDFFSTHSIPDPIIKM